MFDVGFLELLFVAIIALLILGPERLPVAVRTVGLTIGRIKRGFADVRAQVEREIGADEIRQQLHNERILANLEKKPDSTKDATQETTTSTEPESAAQTTPSKPSSNVKRQRQQTVTSTEQTAAAAEPSGDANDPAVTESQPRPNE
ncbi:MAG: Sec-independent protein translocase protein TatB [Pseudomonas sp.]